MSAPPSPAADYLPATPEKTKEKSADGELSKAALSRCLVYCRLRPKNKTDFKEGGFKLVDTEKNRVIVKDERHYDFDGTFGEDCTQEDVFESVAVPCINHAFDGFCSALMCYGQTGTGKSFTMCNTTPGQEGVIPRAARFILGRIEADTTRKYEVVAQFVQIYRDHLGDLMTGTGKDRVEIHFDDTDGVYLTGCSSHVLRTVPEFMKFYQTGNERRVVTATAINPESSRGHTALILRIISENDNLAEGQVRGKITFIDLAGYERFSKTGISYDNPIMKDEAKCINASLLSLGHVVSALSGGGRHIPWRNSKLTRILQDSIGGRSRTSVILTVGPSSDHLHETTNTLQFGLRAMAVKVAAKQSVSVDYRRLAERLQTLLDERNEQINYLEVQIASRDAEREDLMQRYEQDLAALRVQFESDFNQLTVTGASQKQIDKLREVYNVEVQNLEEQRAEAIRYQEEAYSKEIIRLIRDQEHQENKRRTEMRLAQERIIEEFQGKLDQAREGTNEDLIKALQKLAEKDAILASRANDTARLHEHIQVLTEQIRELGGSPVQEATFPETFLDVGQAEEMQRQLEAEAERQRSKVVEVRTELDRLSVVCSERLSEIAALEDENKKLRDVLSSTGAEVAEVDEVTEFLRMRRTEMVDSAEMETLRVMMQADVDELRARNAELEKELERLRTERHSVPLTARVRGTARCPLPLASMTARGRPPLVPDSDGSASPLSGAGEARAMRQLSDQLTFRMRESASLQTRVAELEGMITAQGGVVPQPYVPPIKIAIPVAAQSAQVPTEAPVNSDVEVLMRAREEEMDALLETVERQEYQLTSARSMEEFHQSVIADLRQQLLTANIAAPEPTGAPPPLSSIAMDEYMSILRAAREGSRRLAARLVERDTGDDALDVEALLEEKDREIQLKDELVVEHASRAQYVAKLCLRLKAQMEDLGIKPCCQLPESYRELIEREEWEIQDQGTDQRELERRLQKELEEKSSLQKMLDSLSEERERNAAVMSSVQARYAEMQKREVMANSALSRLTYEKSQKEVILEETLRRATRELMDTQARLIKAEETEKLGFFAKLLHRRR